MKFSRFMALFFIIAVLAGCGGYKRPISDSAEYDLRKPVDCATAREDIMTLQNEKAAVSDQVKSGVKMFVPAAAARSILHRDYLNREKVATGEYNSDIDAKIKEIKSACGLE